MKTSQTRRSPRRAAFTLVEVLVVAAILAILAAVVLPQFAGASDDAKLNSLTTTIKTMRAHLELYRLHHNNQYPTSAANLPTMLTTYTDINHNTNATKTGAYVYGRYLDAWPDNPFTGTNDVTTSSAGATKAWYYNPATGEFRTNDTVHDSL